VVLFGQEDPARLAFKVRLGKQAMDFELHTAPLDQALLAAMAARGR
jgi:hypothetical protein